MTWFSFEVIQAAGAAIMYQKYYKSFGDLFCNIEQEMTTNGSCFGFLFR